MQLDWSLDGNYLQTVTADYDLAFCKFELFHYIHNFKNMMATHIFVIKHSIFILGDIKALSPEKSPIAMKDVKWSTYNSTVGFLVSGW